MNDTRHNVNALRPADTEALQARYALRVAARLSERAEMTEHHIDERLRVARERALDRARARRAAVPSLDPVVVTVGSAAALTLSSSGDDEASSWWSRLGLLLPLLVLIAGLILIQYQHTRLRTAAVAEIDVDLLVDELPPRAYSDPGFVEFLKTSHQP